MVLMMMAHAFFKAVLVLIILGLVIRLVSYL